MFWFGKAVLMELGARRGLQRVQARAKIQISPICRFSRWVAHIFNSRYYHPWNERRQPVLLVEVGPLAPLTLATETTYACVEYATVGTHKDAIIQ